MFIISNAESIHLDRDWFLRDIPCGFSLNVYFSPMLKLSTETECVYIYMIDWPEKENDDLLIYTQRKKLSTPMFF